MVEVPQQLLSDACVTEAMLERILSERAAGITPRLFSAMRYAVLGGGKRLRAGLVLGAARLASQDVESQVAVEVAASFECLHAYSLVHDDLPAMDDAETRRGRAACHVAFDEATAILAGDALQALAFEVLAKVEVEAGLGVGLVADLAVAAGGAGMVGGQMFDLEAETGGFDLSATRRMQAMKTGALIRMAAVSGGRIGGADDVVLGALGVYAENLGLAFQIADDILDRSGCSGDIGKPAGSDQARGKASFVDLMGLEAARGEAERLVSEGCAILTDSVGSTAKGLDYMIGLSCFAIERVS